MQDLIARQTSLSGNLIQLCRFLRSKGYKLSSSDEADALTAMNLLPPISEQRYIQTLKAVICKNQFQFENFEDNYKEYVYQVAKAVDSKTKQLPGKEKKQTSTQKPSLEALKSWLFNKSTEEETELSAFSDIEVLVKKDFSEMNQEELNLILQVLEQLTRKILRRKSRLRKQAKQKKEIDLRGTIRANFRKGTEIQEFIYSKRKEKKLRLVLLCDVSRSMDLYSRFFIQMIYAFQSSYDRINTFVFSTALHEVTNILGNYNFEEAFEIISDRVPQWSGGTKIGQCFDQFYNEDGHHLLDRKTVVMILSDGWDTGAPELMKESMRKIYKSSRKVIWLNPLAGHGEFKPEVIGLKEAMPFINHLKAAHNLESLKEVLRSL